MAVDLTEHLVLVSADRTPLWIDAWCYGEKLLNRGEPAPWNNVGQLAAFAGKLQDLVASDVLMIDVQPFYDYWLHHNPALLEAMAEKRRLGYPLRTLLADLAARTQVHEHIEALCNSNSELPVVLAMPSPRRWMAWAYCRSKGVESVDVSWEDAESASIYVADYLRTFADCPLSGVLLRESPGSGPKDLSEVARYQPVVNVARHYQWRVVLDTGDDGGVSDSDDGEILFLGADIAGLSGVRVTELDGQGKSRHGLAGCYCYIQVPDDAVPETVLDLLASLREPVH
jgi:hypothetical protein